MSKPLQHAIIAFVAVKVTKWSGLPLRENVFIVSSILPDLDFLLFVPIMGRMRGHRTITHSPVFQILLALFFRKIGFWSIFGGMFLHSLVDSVTNRKPSKGIAWFWPFEWERF